jgi:Fe-S cluster assembly iron-binding protein IscA
MLNVTEAARNRLLSKLVHKKLADDVAMRFTPKENGWRMRPDQVRPHDTEFTHQGRKILVMDTTVSEAMSALTLDVIQSDKGARFKLHRPPRED